MRKADFYRQARNDLPGPLAGVRVLEITTSWAGPMCACMLGDLGADVVKVEHPDGEIARTLPPMLPGTDPPIAWMQACVNRNKRSLSLDLRAPEARELCLGLAEKSDIVVENFRTGTLAKWGLGYEQVRERRPDVIYVSITGYGQYGPEAELAGYDPMAQAASGFMALNGDPDGPPMKAATFLGDDLSGLHGAIGALAALSHRERTGEGQHVDVSLFDSLLFQSSGQLLMSALGIPAGRTGNQFPYVAPMNVYECRDGHVYFGAALDSHWRAFTGLMGRPELASDPAYATAPARIERREELNEILAEWFRPLKVEEALRRCGDTGLAIAPIKTYAEAAASPTAREREMVQDTEHDDGSVLPIPGPVAKFSRTPTRVRSAAARLGAHDDELLAELGLGSAEIASLRERGILVRNPDA